MESHLKKICVGAGEVEILEIRIEKAKAGLVRALCEAMAANVPPATAAASAGMNVAELFDALRRHAPALTALAAAQPAGDERDISRP